MENSLESACLNKENIDLINAHGTSTTIGDLAESVAINRVFGDAGRSIPVHSTKSMIGHLIGAAGGVEAIASILAIQNNVIHPSINIFHQDPEIKLNVVANKAIEKPVTNVLSNSFGFVGQNASIILSEYKD
jgi:3-oxoacyl-[acyl-carrier-protein] synthase II